MIKLEKENLEFIKQVISKEIPETEVRVFGSRINDTASKYSDLDLAIVGKEKLPWEKLDALKDIFSESDLPILVDILDWHCLSKDFQQIIIKNYELLQ